MNTDCYCRDNLTSRTRHTELTKPQHDRNDAGPVRQTTEENTDHDVTNSLCTNSGVARRYQVEFRPEREVLTLCTTARHHTNAHSLILEPSYQVGTSKLATLVMEILSTVEGIETTILYDNNIVTKELGLRCWFYTTLYGQQSCRLQSVNAQLIGMYPQVRQYVCIQLGRYLY